MTPNGMDWIIVDSLDILTIINLQRPETDESPFLMLLVMIQSIENGAGRFSKPLRSTPRSMMTRATCR